MTRQQRRLAPTPTWSTSFVTVLSLLAAVSAASSTDAIDDLGPLQLVQLERAAAVTPTTATLPPQTNLFVDKGKHERRPQPIGANEPHQDLLVERDETGESADGLPQQPASAKPKLTPRSGKELPGIRMMMMAKVAPAAPGDGQTGSQRPMSETEDTRRSGGLFESDGTDSPRMTRRGKEVLARISDALGDDHQPHDTGEQGEVRALDELEDQDYAKGNDHVEDEEQVGDEEDEDDEEWDDDGGDEDEDEGEDSANGWWQRRKV
ncbi:hypothetical protein OIO90_004052 [Microbotryomycetes sp. JL221]|nr:hypothetical protein OIO90_004052 [Microbotryomycetes sp. JL221]